MTDYIVKRRERLKDKEITDYVLFGQLGGVIFLLLGYRWFLISYSTMGSLICKGLMLLGVCLFVLGVVCPQMIGPFYKGFSFVGNKVGQLIFDVILSVLYMLLVFPIGIFMKRGKGKYLFVSWDERYPTDEETGFVERKQMISEKSNGVGGTFISLIQVFVANGQYILIPIVVILIAIGIILFFVSSSVMAPFIYTLF